MIFFHVKQNRVRESWIYVLPDCNVREHCFKAAAAAAAKVGSGEFLTHFEIFLLSLIENKTHVGYNMLKMRPEIVVERLTPQSSQFFFWP